MPKKALTAGEHAALLLSAATGVCYRPDCGSPLLKDVDGSQIVAFEIAHIRDELPPSNKDADIGWRYWPDDLTQDERNRFDNLLLLCPPCHKLIDRLRPRDFTVELLLEWKATAEATRPEALELRNELIDSTTLIAAVESLLQPIVLSLPSLTTPDHLSFASRWTPITGREVELAAIDDFLDTSQPFAWWCVVGHAGVGKSRLALEACLACDDDWRVGFAREEDQTPLLSLVPTAPTLVVIDYAASRAPWVGEFLHSIVDRSTVEWPPLRVLVLERDRSDEWFAAATLRKTHHQSVKILACQYAEPLDLGGLAREHQVQLVERALAGSGPSVSSTVVEGIVDRSFELDPAGRPLFVLIAVLEHNEPRIAAHSRDGVLRLLIKRRHAQLGSETATAPRIFVELLSTALGGISLAEMLEMRQSSGVAASMIPAPSTMTTADLDRALPGLVPDILGELWMLDELSGNSVRAETAQMARDVAWTHAPQRYSAFVQRTLRDHPGHPAIVHLFRVDLAMSTTTWMQMAAGSIPYLGWPESPVVKEVMRLIETTPVSRDRDLGLAEARFAIANLHLGMGESIDALHGYSTVIETAPADSDARWKSHTNRGILAMNGEDLDSAERDWTAVIDAPDASDESRACCLNNRADLRVDEGDHHAAIAERTRVLQLSETTFNRRYIALARRAESYLAIGEVEAAVDDIESILATDDIVIEQKMAARLRRVEWLFAGGDPTESEQSATLAREELAIILASRRNFERVELRALELLHRLGDHGVGPDGQRAVTPRTRQRYFAAIRGPH